MENEKYVGKGWSNQYGIKVQLKKQDLLDLPTNQYGDIEVFVGQRKEVDPKSKATHWVKWKNKDVTIHDTIHDRRQVPSEINPALKPAVDKLAQHGWTPDNDLPF
jgi:hypothetical protein